jgi:hypothetical protein
MEDDTGKPYIPRRAGINHQECPEKSKLVDALLRGESPDLRPRKRERKLDRRWGDPRVFCDAIRRWVPA